MATRSKLKPAEGRALHPFRPGLLIGVLVCLLLAFPAFAHSGRTGYSEVAVTGRDVVYALQVPASFVVKDVHPDAPPISLTELRNRQAEIARRILDSIRVSSSEVEATPSVSILGAEKSPGLVTLLMTYRFEQPVRDLHIRYELFDARAPWFENLLKVHANGHVHQMAFTPTRTTYREMGGSAWAQLRSFLELGIAHIFTGYDHILFIVGLVLLGGTWGNLLKTVTAFTVAHSLTLVAAALGIVALPGRLVECAIALSIAYVGLENMWLRKTDHRWLLAFGFGLIHGFGFSGVLAELGLPADHLVTSLLSFNLGVESGQLVILAILFPLVAWSKHWKHQRLLVRLASCAIVGMGLFWFAQRIVGGSG